MKAEDDARKQEETYRQNLKEAEAHREIEAANKEYRDSEAARQGSKQTVTPVEPEPDAPVPVAQIQGAWWRDDKTDASTYAFVEKVDAYPPDNQKYWIWTLTTKVHHTLILTCVLTKLALKHEDYEAMSVKERWEKVQKTRWGFCSNILPDATWVRITFAPELLTNPTSPNAGFWVNYHDSLSDTVSMYKVESICDPERKCTTYDEYFAIRSRELEKKALEAREQRRRGETPE